MYRCLILRGVSFHQHGHRSGDISSGLGLAPKLGCLGLLPRPREWKQITLNK